MEIANYTDELPDCPGGYVARPKDTGVPRGLICKVVEHEDGLYAKFASDGMGTPVRPIAEFTGYEWVRVM